MEIGIPKPSPLHFTLLTLILLITPSPSSSFTIPTPSSFQTLFSLSHSLLTRVANLRADRGDILGSARARTLAHKIEKHSSGFRLYGLFWSVGWDYIKNYAWRDVGFEMFGVVSDINELMKGLTELSRLESGVDRVEWVRRNYGSLLKVSMSLFNRLLKVFTHSGPLKDAVEMVRTEIVDGGLLEDCLELGSSDLKGVIQILKDVALQYTSTNGKSEL
uniref:uncharacterized protein LOC122582807 n=1 Tax=Erigeron canadensis TaxID=72917 RepID=UPI001CB8B8AF|nr:uncharacterized protein LOC122582807 [Erigeron canadensis]